MKKDPWLEKLLEEDLNHERLWEEWEELFVLRWYVRKGGGAMPNWFALVLDSKKA